MKLMTSVLLSSAWVCPIFFLDRDVKINSTSRKMSDHYSPALFYLIVRLFSHDSKCCFRGFRRNKKPTFYSSTLSRTTIIIVLDYFKQFKVS